jgi:hypothetical protein
MNDRQYRNRGSWIGLGAMVLCAVGGQGQAALAQVGFAPVEIAQQRTSTLESAWTDGTGFTSYTWSRASDGGSFYSSSIYTVVSGNTLSIYNTYMSEPLGQFARCGGLGCDLERGELVATIEFAYQSSNTFVVQSASPRASFLQDAQCRITGEYMKVLECSAPRGPSVQNLPSIYTFVPGT